MEFWGEPLVLYCTVCNKHIAYALKFNNFLYMESLPKGYAHAFRYSQQLQRMQKPSWNLHACTIVLFHNCFLFFFQTSWIEFLFSSVFVCSLWSNFHPGSHINCFQLSKFFKDNIANTKTLPSDNVTILSLCSRCDIADRDGVAQQRIYLRSDILSARAPDGLAGDIGG